MLHWHFHFVALCHSVCFFLFFLCSHPPVARQVLPLCLSLKSPPPLEWRALVTTSRCHYALPVTHLFAYSLFPWITWTEVLPISFEGTSDSLTCYCTQKHVAQRRAKGDKGRDPVQRGMYHFCSASNCVAHSSVTQQRRHTNTLHSHNQRLAFPINQTYFSFHVVFVFLQTTVLVSFLFVLWYIDKSGICCFSSPINSLVCKIRKTKNCLKPRDVQFDVI